MGRIIILLSFLMVCIFLACGGNSAPKEVLFVCSHGAARSPIATAYFNRIAKENNLNFHAVFRGTEPNKELTIETVQGLTKDGFDVSSWKPEKVSSQDVGRAYRIITFDCSVSSDNPSMENEEWNNTPSISKDYRIARNVIKANVEELVLRLKAE